MKLDLFEKMPNEALKEITLTELDKETGGETALIIEQPKPQATPEAQTQPQPQTQGATFSTVQPQAGAQQVVNLSQLLTGETPVRLLDTLAAPLMAVGAKMVTGREVPKKVFQMSAEERKTVEPVLNNALAQLNVNFNNPFIALAVSLGAVYAGKVITVISDIDKYEVVTEPEEVREPRAAHKTSNRGRHKKECASFTGGACNCKG